MPSNEIPANLSDDEISLTDIIYFFTKHSKMIAMVTFGLTAIAIIPLLLIPRPYKKSINLSVTLLAASISIRLPNHQQVDMMTVGLIENYYHDIDTIDAKIKKYNTEVDTSTLRLFQITVSTQDRNYLTNLNQEISQLLHRQLPNIVHNSLDESLFSINISIDKQKLLLEQLEKEILQIPNLDNSSSEKIRKLLRLEALERKRTDIINQISSLEFDREYLQSSQNQIGDLIAKLFIIDIISESPIKPASSRLQIAVLAFISSFLVAVLAAVIKEKLSLLKLEKRSPKVIETEKP